MNALHTKLVGRIVAVYAMLAYVVLICAPPALAAGSDTRVVHEPIPYFVPGKRIRLQALATDPRGVRLARAYFKAGTQAEWLYVPMEAQKTVADSFIATIPALAAANDTLQYLFLVVNQDQKIAKTKPWTIKAKKDTDGLVSWQMGGGDGQLTVYTELPTAPSSAGVFGDSVVQDLTESGLRFGVTAGVYSDRRDDAHRPDIKGGGGGGGGGGAGGGSTGAAGNSAASGAGASAGTANVATGQAAGLATVTAPGESTGLAAVTTPGAALGGTQGLLVLVGVVGLAAAAGGGGGGGGGGAAGGGAVVTGPANGLVNTAWAGVYNNTLGTACSGAWTGSILAGNQFSGSATDCVTNTGLSLSGTVSSSGTATITSGASGGAVVCTYTGTFVLTPTKAVSGTFSCLQNGTQDASGTWRGN